MIREGVEEIFGAICEPCHLWVKDYRMLPETALEELYALHVADTGQRVSKRHRPEFLCKPEWESIRVKVTPPVGEWRTKPYSLSLDEFGGNL